MEWLVVSLAASVVFTVLLNVAIRMWPDAAARGVGRITDWSECRGSADDGSEADRGRLIVPWKTMLIASIVATVLLNVLLRLW